MRILRKRVVSSDGSLVGRVKDLVLLDNEHPIYIVAGGRRKYYALLPQDIKSVGEMIVADNIYKVNIESQFEKALFIFSRSAKSEVVGKSGHSLGYLRGLELDDERHYPKIILKNKIGEMTIPCSMISGERDNKIVINSE